MVSVSAEYSTKVFEAVQKIPEGKVSTYKMIAFDINRPRTARQVGQALKHLGINNDGRFTLENVPWWRVLSSTGHISKRTNSNSEIRQAEKLMEEGITVVNQKVNLREYAWFS